LRTVRDYRDRWEQVEKDNLQKDILRRIKNINFDKDYRENYEPLDLLAMDKFVDDELVPKEGEEPLDDDTKQLMGRKLRFQQMTKAFYVPAPVAETPKAKAKAI